MTLDYSKLKAEVQTDPLQIGYGQYLASGNHIAVANLLNSTTGPGSSGIPLTSLQRDQFMLNILPAISAIASGNDVIKDKWDRILGVIKAADFIHNNQSIQYLLQQSVADGLWTQPQANAVFVRNGSRAEVLFGQDAVLTHIDVGTALIGS
jgi:hypothetical protein